MGWRFTYLRVITLEKIGRDAFEKGDLITAEKRALEILSMTYRLEGANLLADVYIKKIEDNLIAGNKIEAQNNLNYILRFEISQDRQDKLTELKSKI